MDRVRFGRALGMGARAAARTAMEAAQAAAAPSPAPQRPRARPTIIPPQHLANNVRPATRAAVAGVTAPLRKASRALWYELTGSFFALFALSFGAGAWHTRASLASAIPADRNSFYAFCAFTLLFAYFSISSFLRARKR